MLFGVERWPPTAKICFSSELFGAMKNESSLHWHGDATGNKVDRNKKHPLISPPSYKLEKYFPILCSLQALGYLFHTKSAAFAWQIILYKSKQQENKKKQEPIDNMPLLNSWFCFLKTPTKTNLCSCHWLLTEAMFGKPWFSDQVLLVNFKFS